METWGEGKIKNKNFFFLMEMGFILRGDLNKNKNGLISFAMASKTLCELQQGVKHAFDLLIVIDFVRKI